MKYTIEGFSQKRLLELGLDATDAVLLRWFVDFKDTERMRAVIIGDRPYYWIDYKYVLEQLPIVSPDTNVKVESRIKRLKRRFTKLIEAGVLTRTTKPRATIQDNKMLYRGAEVFFATSEAFDGLIQDSLRRDKNVPPQGRDKNVPPYSSINDSSINDESISASTEEKTTKKPEADRVTIGAHFSVPASHWQRLLSDYYESDLRRLAETMNDWIDATKGGKSPYKDYAAALRNWIRKEGVEQRLKETESPLERYRREALEDAS